MKRINKKEVTIIAFVFLIFISFCYSYVGREKETYSNEKYILYNYAYCMPKLYYADSTTPLKEKQKIEESLAEFDKIYNQMNIALVKEDYNKYNLNATKLCLLYSLFVYELYYEYKETSDINHKLYDERKQMADLLFEKVGLNQGDYYYLIENVYNSSTTFIWDYPSIVLRASMYYEQYEKGLPPLSSGSSDSASSIMHILEELMPYLLVVLVGVVCLDMVDNDRKQGTLKLLLTQPKKRSVYLVNKTKIYAKKTALIVFIPLVLTLGFIGVQSGFKTLASPVLAYEKGMVSLKGLKNNLKEVHYIYDNPERTTYFSNILINPDNPGDVEPQNELDLIPFWKLLLVAAIFTVVLIWFYVSLNLLMHTLISNPIVASMCFLCLAGFGVAISAVENACAIYNILNPFTYRNPIYAITGYTGYSFLFSVIVLLFSLFVINRINTIIFKRKDIA